MGGNRTPIVDQLELDEGRDNWVIGYHRHLMSGGEPVDIVPSRLRRISVQEAAAIQTFPDRLEWQGRQSAVYRQIGNAVPPLLAYHVARALGEAIGMK
jgi:DNA (cytosine-5)-methyltransferase 1